jgi:rod shape-determining protein MreC
LTVFILVAVAVIIVQIGSVRNERRSFIESFLQTLVFPVQKFLCLGGKFMGDIVSDAREFGSLHQENMRLKAEVLKIKEDAARCRDESSENKKLRSLAHFASRYGRNGIPAETIGRDVADWFNSVQVDKGTTSGAGKHMVAVNPEGLVGRVIEVFSHSSRIRLIMDYRSAVPAIVSETRSLGIVYGGEGNLLTMKYISIDSQARPGYMVYTSGLGKIFPKGVLLGEIISIRNESGSLFKSAVVKPAVDFGALENLLLVEK